MPRGLPHDARTRRAAQRESGAYACMETPGEARMPQRTAPHARRRTCTHADGDRGVRRCTRECRRRAAGAMRPPIMMPVFFTLHTGKERSTLTLATYLHFPRMFPRRRRGRARSASARVRPCRLPLRPPPRARPRMHTARSGQPSYVSVSKESLHPARAREPCAVARPVRVVCQTKT